ncbi:hypothetical protein WMY93_033111 [Mugilogobius chulae]|uniref:G-protein coupled receptors family 1 profile domain-containing protein n=1 Tax=Mugilogobius chulae TaxID=88201 RepID=A0AAW0MTQ0_9GOBI
MFMENTRTHTCVSVHKGIFNPLCHPQVPGHLSPHEDDVSGVQTRREARVRPRVAGGVRADMSHLPIRSDGAGDSAPSAAGPAPPQNSSHSYVNCWDDAIDQEFNDYVPYGVVLHLLGFFLPFVVIAWCYSQVVRTIFQTLRSPPSSVEEGGGVSDADTPRERTSVSIAESQYSHYIRRRRKSIKTIVTITLLFALCFLPFHVTRTLFLLLKRRAHTGDCAAVRAVSVCYKVTRPLASCNAWLNALLYFLTGDKSAPCCPRRATTPDNALWWPLTLLKKDALEEEPEAERVERETRPDESKSSRILF